MSIYDDGPLSTYPETYGDVYGEGGGIVGLVLGLTAELHTGEWTDITAYLYQRNPVQLQLGRQDESSQISPASCTLTLDNRDGRFTTRNPTGAYYPAIGQNTPFRLSVPSWLAGLPTTLLFADDTQSYVSCPDSAALQLGELDARIDMWLDDYQPCTLAGKWGGSDTLWAWCLTLNADGTVSLTWYDGSNVNTAQSTVPLPYLGRVMVRATLAVSGAGLVTFYTAPSMSGTQTQLGDVVTVAGASGAQAAATQAVQVGYVDGFLGQGIATSNSGCLGRVFEFALYNSSAVLVADPQFSAQAAGATSFTDTPGNTWATEGAAVLDARCYRFHGEMSAWPKAADPSSRDAYSQATASGVLRRLQKDDSPVLSVMRRGITGTIIPVFGGAQGYWPFEDNQGSAQVASGLPGGGPMLFSGTPAFAGQPGSPSADSVFACSAGLVQAQSAVFSWTLPTRVTSALWGHFFLLAIPSGGLPDGAVLVNLAYSGEAWIQFGYAAAGNGTLTVLTSTAFSFNGPAAVNGQAYWVRITSDTTGGTVSLDVLPLGDTTSTSYGGGVSWPSATAVGGSVNPGAAALSSTEFGHLLASSNPPAIDGYAGLLNAWAGETAANRVVRLAAENGLNSRIYGFPDASVLMGVQSIDTLANLLGYCETTDMGMLYEPRETVGIGYRTSASMCNQAPATTADYSQQQVSQGFADTADDLLTLNQVTVTNNTGSSYVTSLASGAMSVQDPPDGIGVTDDAVTVYPLSDTQLPDLAGWLLHVRSVDEDRYPSIPFQMARPETPQTVPLLRIGDYAQITETPYWIPPGPVKQLCAGFTETFAPGILWPIVVNGVPESPYEVAAAGTGAADSALAESSGTALATGYSSTATSFSVDVTGALWVTGTVAIPAMVAGEEVEITDITGASSPQTFTVTRSVNGVVKAQASGAAITLADEPILALAGAAA